MCVGRHHSGVVRTLQQLVFDGVMDDFGRGEPVEFLIDLVTKEFGALTPKDVLSELLRLQEAGLMWVRFATADGSERTVSSSDLAILLSDYEADSQRKSYIISDSVIAGITCRGRAEWRKNAEQWQLDLSGDDGRVIAEGPDEVTVVSICEELARQLLAEWLDAHPTVSIVAGPPRIEETTYSASPGFPVSGKRVTWRVIG
jgi:hypothetical protein